MALVISATYQASSKTDLAGPASTSPSFTPIVSPQTPLITTRPSTTEAPVPMSAFNLNQQQCASTIESTPVQTSGSDIISEPVLDCVAAKPSDGRDIVARKGTLQSLRQVRRRFSLFQKANSKWPDPEESVGKFCGMKGRYRCWEAKGPAEEAFKVLSKDIAALLERTCGPVPSASQVIFEIFMVGETPSTAVPQIMFSCHKAGPRKEAMETLKKSGLLSRYPGIETGHWQFPPHILNPQLLATGKEPASSTQTMNSELILVPLYASFSTSSASASTESISAMRLYSVSGSEANGSLLKATAGSLACFAGKTFYITVAHAFIERGASDVETLCRSADDDGDSEFEFGGLSDVENNLDDPDGQESETDDSGSMTSEASGSQDDFNHDLALDESSEGLSLVGSDASLKIQPDMSYSLNGDDFEINSRIQQSSANFATTYLESTDLDYALVEPRSDQILMSPLSSLPMISLGKIGKIRPGETRIMVVTGSSGLLYGTLSGKPSYIRLMSSKTFQEAYTVAIDGPLFPGDSGSMVVDSETSAIYGHMVVGSTVSRIAYILPASNVLNDLKLREEMILHTAIDVEPAFLETENGKAEEFPRPSELQPDSRDLRLQSSSFEGDLGDLGTGHTDATACCTYDPSLCSEVESIFSENDSIASSNSSIGELHSSALSEIVNLLLHSDLRNFYPAAITKLGPEKFQRNFRRFLLRYGRQLLREASNHFERQAAIFVRRSATQIAIEIRESIARDAETPTQRPSIAAQLNEWLQAFNDQEDEREEDDLSESSGSEDWEPHDDASLDKLEEVKTFMVAGRAFLDLCESFQRWLKLGEKPKDDPSTINTFEATETEEQEVEALVENKVAIASSPPTSAVEQVHIGPNVPPPGSISQTSDDEEHTPTGAIVSQRASGHLSNDQPDPSASLLKIKKSPAYYMCNTCSTEFTSADNMEAHKRTHTILGRYHCQNCPYDFARKPDMLRHMEEMHCGRKTPVSSDDIRQFLHGAIIFMSDARFTSSDGEDQAPNPASLRPVPIRLAPDGYGNEISPDAKWTRLNRCLVSPEVLDQDHRRYEARPEWVAVLGVLSRAEIESYTARSTELRDARRGRSQAALPKQIPPPQLPRHVPIPRTNSNPHGHDTQKGETINAAVSSSEFPFQEEDTDSELEGSQDGQPDVKLINTEALIRSDRKHRHHLLPGMSTFSAGFLFDSHLEHVRPILQVDRPLAINGEFSPIEAYDSDTEFPLGMEDKTLFKWELMLSNFPPETPARLQLPVRVEKVFLSSDEKRLVLSVIVANLGPSKQVTARFTLDNWKTASELVAEFKRDIRQPAKDGHNRFNFHVKLANQANLEGKTMFFYVRYLVEGQEYWDNNDSRNFQVEFRKHAKKQKGKARTSPLSNRQSKVKPVNFVDFREGFDSTMRTKGAKSVASLASDDIQIQSLGIVSRKPFANPRAVGAAFAAAFEAAKTTFGEGSGITTTTLKANPELPDRASNFLPTATPKPPGDTITSQSYGNLVDESSFFASVNSSTEPKDSLEDAQDPGNHAGRYMEED